MSDEYDSSIPMLTEVLTAGDASNAAPPPPQAAVPPAPVERAKPDVASKPQGAADLALPAAQEAPPTARLDALLVMPRVTPQTEPRTSPPATLSSAVPEQASPGSMPRDTVSAASPEMTAPEPPRPAAMPEAAPEPHEAATAPAAPEPSPATPPQALHASTAQARPAAQAPYSAASDMPRPAAPAVWPAPVPEVSEPVAPAVPAAVSAAAPVPVAPPPDAQAIAERLRGQLARYLAGDGRALIEERCRSVVADHTSWLVGRITREVTLTLEAELAAWVRDALREQSGK